MRLGKQEKKGFTGDHVVAVMLHVGGVRSLRGVAMLWGWGVGP